jgi:hypothetical protein
MKKKLNYKNEWMSDIYSIDGNVVLDLKYVEIDGVIYAVETRHMSLPYSDHGKEYYGSSFHFFIQKEVFGVVMNFDLNQIVHRKNVYALDYVCGEKVR